MNTIAQTRGPEPTPTIFLHTSDTTAILLGSRGPERFATPVEGLAPIQVIAQLERILASRTFARLSRLSGFLAFVVEQTVAGRKQALSEYELGVRVFYRDAEFNPRIDSIVRVEARRLRKVVERYYETEGRNDSVLIQLPRGTYVPSFSMRHSVRRAA